MKCSLFALIAAATTILFCVIARADNEPVQPIEPAKISNPAMVELGKKLYFDPRLSISGYISCNSCHNLSMGGTDNLKTSIGHNWQQGPINSPTVFNSSLNVAQFWDGRAKDLKAQAGGPIANPGEMASTHQVVIEVLASIPEYVAEFHNAFGDGSINIDKVTTAIAAFEKTLVTPNSRFDRWLKGDSGALAAMEVAGYELFRDSGCTACHNGPAIGGASFEKLGVFEPYKTTSKTEGRSAVTGDEADRHHFKVPTLRNIALTYPYFHDGEVATLQEAVDIMGRLQLGKKFTDKEIAQIVAFLGSLTGERPAFQMPVLPPSTNKTPKPKPFD